jgi:predicted polyphosphate/ATP-dependent NAD kinase
VVIATENKIASLHGRSLLVDTGEQTLDEELSGFTKVVTGLGKYNICKVE